MEYNYKFRKQIKGTGNYAAITLIIEESEPDNIILEQCNGLGFTSQGSLEYVTTKGYDDWKNGAKAGLTQALSLIIDKKYKIIIKSIEGLTSDTNSETVAYTAYMAICNYLEIEVSENTEKEFEQRIIEYWQKIK